MDIRKSPKAPDTTIIKSGHTTNGAFGSDPNASVKGSRPTRDVAAPTAKR